MSQTDSTQCTHCGAPIAPQDQICKYCSTPNPRGQQGQNNNNNNNVTETRTETIGPNGMRTVTVTKKSSSTTTTTSTSSTSSSGTNPDIDMSSVQNMMSNFTKNMGKGIMDPNFMNDMDSMFQQPTVQPTPTVTPTAQPQVQTPAPAPKGGCLGMILVVMGIASALVWIGSR